MVEMQIRPLDGFEQEFEIFNSKKMNLEQEFEIAKQRAIAEVEQIFENRKSKINDLLAQVSKIEEVEVPEVAEMPEEVVTNVEENNV